MAVCCPPGRGCNQPTGNEPCALKLCGEMAAAEPRAALALVRWGEWRRVRARPDAKRLELRFRRRAYERARDAALIAVLMRRARSQPRARKVVRVRPSGRRGVLLGEHRSARRR